MSPTDADPFDLERFVAAQDEGATYERALTELGKGRKESHWMWFVFPQLAGLGQSGMSRRYAISGPAEARAYLAHPVLGPRLRAAAVAAAAVVDLDADAVFGRVDGLKLRSSMTLFRRIDPDEAVFRDVLGRYFGGRTDPETDRLLQQAGQ
jgi:uncharacterized protein (DUF1810 family)